GARPGPGAHGRAGNRLPRRDVLAVPHRPAVPAERRPLRAASGRRRELRHQPGNAGAARRAERAGDEPRRLAARHVESVLSVYDREDVPRRRAGDDCCASCPLNPMYAAIGTLILATSLIQLANGFFRTLISLRMAIEDFGSTLAGLGLSSYFAGFTLGAMRCARIIERVGHIRAYAAFAGLVAAATAAMPLWVGPIAWLVLRAVVGFGCGGLSVTAR